MINKQEKNLKKLPLTSDYVFKRIFGQEENKEALKDEGQQITKELRLLNTEVSILSKFLYFRIENID